MLRFGRRNLLGRVLPASPSPALPPLSAASSLPSPSLTASILANTPTRRCMSSDPVALSKVRM